MTKLRLYIKNTITEVFLKFSIRLNKINKNAHQLSNSTSYNRYPHIFNRVALLLKGVKNPKILSFGCSIGHECISIKMYIPESIVIGTDINKLNLLIARFINNNKGIYYKSNVNLGSSIENNSYDAIFCMSVLCKHKETKDISDSSNIYSFEMFQHILESLDEKLKINGFLIIYNSNFRFTDLIISKKYTPLLFDEIIESGFVKKFDQNNKALSDQNYPLCIFVKQIL